MKFLMLIIGLFFSLFSAPKNNFNNQKEPEIAVKSVQINDATNDFITYWKEDFRLDDKGEVIAICDITKADFRDMYYNHYLKLSATERANVNKAKDLEEGYTIKDSIDQLAKMYISGKSDSEAKSNLDQPTSIIIVVSVAIFGITSISIFFIFKQEKFIQ